MHNLYRVYDKKHRDAVAKTHRNNYLFLRNAVHFMLLTQGRVEVAVKLRELARAIEAGRINYCL